MPRKKNTAKKTEEEIDEVEETPPQTYTPSYTRGPSNFLILLLIVVSFFAGYLFYKVKNLENLNKQGTPTQNAGAAHLTAENLKKYAKDLKLDTNKFNSCLDEGDKKAVVDADLKLGGELGVQGTPGFLVNGRFLGGAFPFEFFKEIIDKELAGTATSSCSDYSEELQKYCDETGKNSFNPVPKTIDTGSLTSKGKLEAKITLVEFSDFECPYCIRAYPTVKQVLQSYPNDVKFYYKQFPLNNIHPKAQKAAEASLCAGDQGKFWEYHDRLFEVANAT